MRKSVGYVATIAILFALWVLATGTRSVSDQILPSVGEVATAFGELSTDGQITINLASTIFRVLLSFIIGVVLGIPLGALLWRIPFVSAAVHPYLSAIY